MPEIYIDFNQHELFDDETKAILTAVLLQARDDSKPITLARKKDFPKNISYNGQTYSVTLSHSINLYPAENGELQFEVLGHTNSKAATKDVLSYKNQLIKVISRDGLLKTFTIIEIVKKVILEGQIKDTVLTIAESSRVQKTQIIELESDILKQLENNFRQTAYNEIDNIKENYPDVFQSQLIVQQRTNEFTKIKRNKIKFSLPGLANKTYSQILDNYKNPLSESIPFKKTQHIVENFLTAEQQFKGRLDQIIVTNNIKSYGKSSGVEIIQVEHIYSAANIYEALSKKTTILGFITDFCQLMALFNNDLPKSFARDLADGPLLNQWIKFFEKKSKEQMKSQMEKLEIKLDFDEHKSFDDETKAILAALLLQARGDLNQPITLSRKKDFPKDVIYNGQTYSVTLSHSINLYSAENGQLQFEVLGHTADPRYTAAKLRSKDVVSYSEQRIKVKSEDGVLRKAFETVVVKKVILQGQIEDTVLTLVKPLQPRVHKSQKFKLKGKFLKEGVENVFYQTANEVDINTKIYPGTSPLLLKRRTDESKKTDVIKTRFSMPYLAGKTYDQILDSHKDKSSEPIPFTKILQMINAFLQAMKQLEEKKVVHCDLHPNNVLFDEQEQVAHIIDFDNAFREGDSIVPTKHAKDYVAPEVHEALLKRSELVVTQATHIYSVARIVHDLIHKTTTIGFIQKVKEQMINLKTELLTPGLSENLEARPVLDAWISFFKDFQQEYEKILQEQTQKKLSSEIDKVLQLDEPLSYEADLDVLHALIKQEIDKSGNHNKLDRKKTYACQSEDGLKIIKLSHSIVRHTDTAGNIFYDVYARDHDIDGEKIRYANATIGAAKKNVLGIGGFGKVKPIIGRFFEQDGKLVQISHPGLVTKIIREHPSSKLKDYEQEVSIASKSYRAVSEILQRQGKKGVQIFDYVMPYLPGSNVDQLAFKQKKWIFRKEFIQNLDIVIASCEAVKTFHKETKCLHGDIKPANICYDPDTKTAFLIDLGEREYLLGEELNRLTMIHTKKFAAPEIRNSNILFSIEINEKIDIYSLGVTIDYLLNGEITKGKYNEKTQFHMLPYVDKNTHRKNGKELFKFLQKMRCEDSEERPDIDEVITFFSALRVAYSRKNSDEQIGTNNNDVRAVYSNPSIYIRKLEILAKNIDEVLIDIEKEKNRFENESHDLKTDKYHAFKMMHENLEGKKIDIEEKIKKFKSDLSKIDNQVFTTKTRPEHQKLYDDCKSFFENSIRTTVRIVSLKTKGNDLIGKHTNALWQEERTNIVWQLLRKIFAGLIKTDSAKSLIKAESNLKEIDPDVVVDDMNQPDPSPTPVLAMG